MTLKFALPFGQEEIKKCIPHRDPFLLVDEVVSCEPGKVVVAKRKINKSNPVFEGHFPGNPIYPGVLQVEGLAQTSGILVALTPGKEFSSCVFTDISKFRFKRPVSPENILEYYVTLEKSRGLFFWFVGTAKVNGEVVCEGNFSARMFP